ncbi:acetyltransferase [Sphingomonas qilianensis]|uniref:Acetyltransferase n=1 Tax=Sphingomonas qilianensis TaxID=1736690 RepID=A0ABU9XRJ8_9SPHN
MALHDPIRTEAEVHYSRMTQDDPHDIFRSSTTVQLPCSTGGSNPEAIFVCLAESSDQRNSATELVNHMYARRGYGGNHSIPQTSLHTTFTARTATRTIGTITLAIDSAAGLAADTIFRAEIDAFRQVPGAKVCELTKLAFDTEAPSKPLLAAMFHVIFIYGQRRHDCTDLFIEVNPRHTRFYEVMLGFERVGTLKTNASVAAPAQLLRLEIKKIHAALDGRQGCGENRRSRSLYPYFRSNDVVGNMDLRVTA